MRIIVVFMVIVFLSLNSESERLRYQALILKNMSQQDIEVTTFPPLRFTGLAEKYITYQIDSASKDTAWLWQFGAMNLEIIQHTSWWFNETENASIEKGIYLMKPNSTINLGSRVEPAKNFGVFQESDLRIDSMMLRLGKKQVMLTRKDILGKSIQEGKKKDSPLILDITCILSQ